MLITKLREAEMQTLRQKNQRLRIYVKRFRRRIMEKYLDNFGWVTICFSIIYIGGHVIVAWFK